MRLGMQRKAKMVPPPQNLGPLRLVYELPEISSSDPGQNSQPSHLGRLNTLQGLLLCMRCADVFG